MKKLIILLLLMLLPAAAYPIACTDESPILTAGSANQADVQLCVDIMDYGDTINIPACADGDCVWTSQITITKNVTIAGAGKTSTYLTNGFTNNSTEEAFFKFVPDDKARNNLDSLETDEGIFEVSDIHFKYGSTRLINKFGIWISNYNTPVVKRIRIHDCSFTNIHRAVQVVGYVHGVFDSNTLVNTNASYPQGAGLGAWTNDVRTIGTSQSWYIEDNTLSFDGAGTISGAANSGGSQVVRYNDMTGTGSIYIESHSNQGGAIKGGFFTEIYGNDFTGTASQGIDMRGGNDIIFFNIANDDTLIVREEFYDAYSGAIPAQQCTGSDYSTGSCVGACPQICLDDCTCYKVNHSYIFNNRRTLGGAVQNAVISYDRYDNVAGHDNDPPELVENREFFNYNASFDGSAGLGCGNAAARAAITPTALGVGFWETDQSCSDLTDYIGANPTTPISGTLYRATSDGGGGYEWTAYYTPYTYPHPLTVPDVVISEVTAVPTPSSDITPSYTFTTDTAGTVTYGGDCGSTTDLATAVEGNNTVTYTLPSSYAATYSNCTIKVGNSNTLTLTEFVVTGPTVALTAPTTGNKQGEIEVSGTCTHDDGCAGVTFILSGSAIAAEDTESPYTIAAWDTTTRDNATYNIWARGRATGGAIADSTPVSITINNPVGYGVHSIMGKTIMGRLLVAAASDNTPPIVTAFVIPETSESLTVPISAFECTDAFGVTGYCLQLSDSPVGCDWSETAQEEYVFASAGAKTLYAFCHDAAPNASASLNDSVTITLPLTVETFSTSYLWEAPAGVTSVTVELWAGGGQGGGGGGTNNRGGSGGSGGQYVKKVVTVEPFSSYQITIGAGGSGGAYNAVTGTVGEDTTFGGTTVVAKGGAGGLRYSSAGTPGASGSITGGVGDTVRAGGNGGASSTSAIASGGGGGGAGGYLTNAYTGTNANGTTAGGQTTDYANTLGGVGGQGLTNNNTAGNPGGNYGAGGSGGTRNQAGGAGGPGYARLTY